MRIPSMSDMWGIITAWARRDVAASLIGTASGNTVQEELDAGGVWERDEINGHLYPSTLTDKVGIGIDTPTQMLEAAGLIKSSV